MSANLETSEVIQRTMRKM